jgi:flagellar protein FliJ
MKNFKFRMQSVLQLRQRERDQAADAYRQATAAIDKLQGQIDQLRTEADHQINQVMPSGAGRINAQQLIETQRYRSFVDQQVAHLGQQLQLIHTESEKRRQRLVEREQSVRALEKLQERQRAAWESERAKQEQNVLDDWAGFQHWSKQSP